MRRKEYIENQQDKLERIQRLAEARLSRHLGENCIVGYKLLSGGLGADENLFVYHQNYPRAKPTLQIISFSYHHKYGRAWQFFEKKAIEEGWGAEVSSALDLWGVSRERFVNTN